MMCFPDSAFGRSIPTTAILLLACKSLERISRRFCTGHPHYFTPVAITLEDIKDFDRTSQVRETATSREYRDGSALSARMGEL